MASIVQGFRTLMDAMRSGDAPDIVAQNATPSGLARLHSLTDNPLTPGRQRRAQSNTEWAIERADPFRYNHRGYQSLGWTLQDMLLCRALYRKSPYVRALVNFLVDNAIGDGFRVKFRDERLQRQWDATRFNLRRPRERLDVTLKKILREVINSGDALVQFGEIDGKMGVWILDAVNLPITGQYGVTPAAGGIVDGIKYDRDERPVSYHFQSHGFLGQSIRTPVVPAYQMWHGYHEEFPSQLRGVSWTMAAIEPLWNLARWTRSYVTMMVIHSQMPLEFNIPLHYLGEADPEEAESEDVTAQGGGMAESETAIGRRVVKYNLEAAVGGRLVTTGDITVKTLDLPSGMGGDTYINLINSLLNAVARSYGLTVSAGKGDESDGNYSSLMFGAAMNGKTIKNVQNFALDFLESLVAQWVAHPSVEISNFDISRDVTIIAPIGAIADPLRATQAKRLEVESGMRSRRSFAEAQGIDWADEFEQILSEERDLSAAKSAPRGK